MGVFDSLPDLTGSASGIGRGLVIGVTVILVAIIVIIIFAYFLINKRYKYKIIIFEKINNRFEPSRRDRGAIIPMSGGGGDTVLYLRKHKKYLPTPEIQTGRRVYWFAIREDGEWFNIGIENIDEKFREVGAKFLHQEMRYARTQLMAKIKERYDKPSFWAQYAGIIVNVAAITIIMVFLFLIVGRLLEIMGSVNGAMAVSKDILVETRQLIGSLDNLKSGGSGIVAQ